MEIPAESIEHTTQKDQSFRRLSIILKIATLGVAFLAIALMSL
jgi:hypothetical protein